MQNLNTEESKNPTVIIGLGPAGLSSALYELEAGRKVVAVSNREISQQAYTRPQRIHLDKNFWHLINMIKKSDNFELSEDNEKLLSQIKRDNNTAAISDCEKLLFSVLTRYQKENSSQLTTIQSDKKSSNNITINSSQHEITIKGKDKEEHKFTYSCIADCTGGRRVAINQVTPESIKPTLLTTKQLAQMTQYQPRHLYHGTVNLTAKNLSRLTQFKTGGMRLVKFSKEQVDNLRSAHGWDKPHPPGFI